MRLREAIELSKYSQRQLAALIGVSEAKLSLVIAGNQELTLSKARALAALVGSTVDELFPMQAIPEAPVARIAVNA
jgi:transcriptional regulator with XRE-family HTH domain